MRIVVVDDDPDFRLLLRLQLDLEVDLRVVGDAADGFAGLALREQERPDAMVIDLMMPGMDGFELARRIREVDRDVIVVCYTAVPSAASEAQLEELDVHMLQKSGSAARVVAELRARWAMRQQDDT